MNPTDTPRLHGSFLQLWEGHLHWGPAGEWAALFDELSQLRSSMLIVQHAAVDRVVDDSCIRREGPRARLEFHRGPGGGFAGSVLDQLLQQAVPRGMSLRLGVLHDGDFWCRQVHLPLPDRTAMLDGLLARSRTLLAGLAPVAADHPAVTGWYLPLEVAVDNWPTPPLEEALFAHLRRTCEAVRAVDGRLPIAISGFANAGTPPSDLADFWGRLLDAVPLLDIVMFQDGVGARKLTLQQLPAYLMALDAVVDARGRELEAIVEVFDHPGAPRDTTGVPGPIDRISGQIAIAASFTDTLVAFQLPHYLCRPSSLPLADVEALREAYVERHLGSIADSPRTERDSCAQGLKGAPAGRPQPF